VFHWDAMKQRLYIISDIFVAKGIVVMFSLAEECKGCLSLFHIFLFFFNSCLNYVSLSFEEQLLYLILCLLLSQWSCVTCLCFNCHLIHAHKITTFAVFVYLKISRRMLNTRTFGLI